MVRLTPGEVRQMGADPSGVDFDSLERDYRRRAIANRGIADPDNPGRLADPDDSRVIEAIRAIAEPDDGGAAELAALEGDA